jgi:hypothetical protein
MPGSAGLLLLHPGYRRQLGNHQGCKQVQERFGKGSALSQEDAYSSTMYGDASMVLMVTAAVL